MCDKVLWWNWIQPKYWNNESDLGSGPKMTQFSPNNPLTQLFPLRSRNNLVNDKTVCGSGGTCCSINDSASFQPLIGQLWSDAAFSLAETFWCSPFQNITINNPFPRLPQAKHVAIINGQPRVTIGHLSKNHRNLIVMFLSFILFYAFTSVWRDWRNSSFFCSVHLVKIPTRRGKKFVEGGATWRVFCAYLLLIISALTQRKSQSLSCTPQANCLRTAHHPGICDTVWHV